MQKPFIVVIDSLRKNVVVLLGTLLTCVLFWPAFEFAWAKWDTDPNYGHAYFVPPAALYLIWKRRGSILAAPVRPSSLGLALALPAVALHVVACNAGLMRFSLIAFVGVLAGGVAVFWGLRMLRIVAAPLFLLLLCVPVPLFLESVTLPMKLIASQLSTAAIGLLGFSIYREGTIIYLPNLTLEVATACSGLKSLVLVFTVGSFYAFVTQERKIKQFVVILSSIPIAIGANVARIVATAILSNFLSSESMRHLVHDFSGFFVFVLAGVAFVALGAVLDFFPGPEAGTPPHSAATEATP